MSGKEKINQEGDLVLVHYEDQPVVYARIQVIEPDIKRGWFQVTLLILTIPHQMVTWILREEYINGGSFTMGGKAMKLEKVEVELSGRTPGGDQPGSGPKGSDKSQKVIALKKQH
jgi:hypothetical protein